MSARNANITLLVFGEERTQRWDAARALEAAGYRVRMASSMAEAAKVMAAGTVTAVVLSDSAAAGAAVERARFNVPIVSSMPGEQTSLAELVHQALDAPVNDDNQLGESE